jgi:hypothetical protein
MKPSPSEILTVRCPTCRAGAGQNCELATGRFRTDPHRDRRLVAADVRLGAPLTKLEAICAALNRTARDKRRDDLQRSRARAVRHSGYC